MALVSYALVQLNQAKSFLNFKGSDSDMEFLINSVTDYIEKRCNRRFKETTYSNEVYDGKCSNELVLRNCPITKMTSLEANYSLQNSSNWEEIDKEQYWFDELTGIITKTTNFVRGKQNYRVSYDAGYSTIPYDVQFLAMSLIKEFITVKDSGGIKQESLGDHSLTFESIMQTNPALKGIMESYRLPVLL